MPGPVGIHFRNIDIDPGAEMRPGDTVTVRIKDILPGGRMSFVWRGRTVTAKSHLFFRPGQVLTAKVERSGAGLRLRLLESSGSPGKSGGPGGPSEPGHEVPGARGVLSSALLRAGLALPGDAEAGRCAALLERTSGRRLRMARLFAEILSKGADPGADFLEAVDAAFDGRGGGRGRNGGNEGRDWPEPPDPEQLVSETASGEEDGDPLLALLSGVDGRSGRWTFRRMERRLAGRNVYLTWKIRAGGDPAVALTVRDGERFFEFLLSGRDAPEVDCYADEGTEVDEAAWQRFRERLALLNFTVSDTLQPIAESDGFSKGAADAARSLEERF